MYGAWPRAVTPHRRAAPSPAGARARPLAPPCFEGSPRGFPNWAAHRTPSARPAYSGARLPPPPDLDRTHLLRMGFTRWGACRDRCGYSGQSPAHRATRQ
ncbi:hypothetical protein NDU88_002937 [Pleurodeles waltl]|uniref:Uncharacterized protein n=1 Tax=Pleurodeles waltl TaxID=8319 RepID=A0AAV7NFE2_PLEWA|nr:hypothetical protein NDU88_002937 [Pleurodeles waltl]